MGRRNRSNKAALQPSNNKVKSHLTPNEKQLAEQVDKLLRISTIPQQPTVLKALENQREIAAITEQVRKLEAGTDKKNSAAARQRTSGATVGDFLKWARENGAELNGCSIAAFPGFELGLKADVDIGKSALVVAVPRGLMMSVERARESALGELIAKDKILGSMANVTLAIFLLVEKFKGDSFWKPYIDILPTGYSTVLYFTVDELEELKGSPTLDLALRQVRSITRQYAYFHKLFHTADDPISLMMRAHFTFTEYCWAVSTVMTRQNTIPFGNDFFALIPLWDLCNHTNGTVSTAYNPLKDRSECLALRDFKAGEQLFIFYGGRTNNDLFIHNGFVYEENEHDCYWIHLGISKSDPLHSQRENLLRKLSIPPSGGEFCLNKQPQPLNGNLLAFLRIFNMNEGQLEHWQSSDRSADLQYVECALDTELEKKAWSFLQNRLKLFLGCYKTTLEEDVKIIAEAKEMTQNRLLAVRMRATEKRILTDTLDYVEQYIKQ